MPTTRKKEIVKDLHGLLSNSQVLVFTDYRGMTVAEISNLRRQLREKGVEYHVTKNTLTTLAANRVGMEGLEQMLDGPTAIAFVGDDIPGGAKVLADFVRTSKVLTIRGGLAGRTLLNPDQVSDLTKILTREQYIAKMLGSMQSPISSMMNVLNGTIRGFMNVMQARIDQLKEQGDTSGAAEDAAPEASVAVETAPEASVAEATTAEDAAPEASVAETAPEASVAREAPQETTSDDAAAQAPAEEATPEAPPAEETAPE
ncbi:MAG TPA: 50S ribosomal protein L10 [Chloroflexia bacterium]|nr:50S ribosomal protein L10 [Chloroflexia bacterium]